MGNQQVLVTRTYKKTLKNINKKTTKNKVGQKI